MSRNAWDNEEFAAFARLARRLEIFFGIVILCVAVAAMAV
jgi:hypothetical protein